MKKIRIGLFSIGFVLFSMLLVSCTQSREDKTNTVIMKLKLVEPQKTSLKYRIESLKHQAEGEDSIRILKLEKQLSDEEISKRITKAFNKIFTDKEVDEIYYFVQSNAYEKFFNSEEFSHAMSTQFKEINDEINNIKANLGKQIKRPKNRFKPIQIDRKNGFYIAVNYNFSTKKKDIKLEKKPSLTFEDILEVKKVLGNRNNKPEISLTFTKEGAKKLYILTKENIGNSLAIVVNKQIVLMPIISSVISGGKINVGGVFSEEKADELIKGLKEK